MYREDATWIGEKSRKFVNLQEILIPSKSLTRIAMQKFTKNVEILSFSPSASRFPGKTTAGRELFFIKFQKIHNIMYTMKIICVLKTVVEEANFFYPDKFRPVVLLIFPRFVYLRWFIWKEFMNSWRNHAEKLIENTSFGNCRRVICRSNIFEDFARTISPPAESLTKIIAHTPVKRAKHWSSNTN
jgi:hypothetical protein